MMSNEKIVYHYCNADVFTKIISSKAIRLSDITKSNDSMEILWITKYIKEIFDEEYAKETSNTKYFKDGYPKDMFSEFVEHYSEDFFKADQRMYSYMVCCFSEASDLLSQWRGYANDASGFSIEYLFEVINIILERDKKMVYNCQRQTQRDTALSFT